jgi:hypothetical protein
VVCARRETPSTIVSTAACPYAADPCSGAPVSVVKVRPDVLERRGCHEAIHQEFTAHHFVKLSERARLKVQPKARTAKLKKRDKENP